MLWKHPSPYSTSACAKVKRHAYLQTYKQWKANDSSGDLKTSLRTVQHLHLLQLFGFVLSCPYFLRLKMPNRYFLPILLFIFILHEAWNQRCCDELNVGSHRADPTQTMTILPNAGNLLTGETYWVTENVANKACQSCREGSLDDRWEDFIAEHSKARQPMATAAMLHQNNQLCRNRGHDVELFPLNLSSTICCHYLSLHLAAGLWLQHTRGSLCGSGWVTWHQLYSSTR